MKRRGFVKALAVAPAVPAVFAQQIAPPTPANRTVSAAAAEAPRLEIGIADDAADMQPRFFNASQFAALRRLCEVLMPRIGDAPGAIDAGAPEFLDFLISEAPKDRQALYCEGLDALNGTAKKRFNRDFAEADAAQITALLDPLRKQWTYEPPSDALARFLWAAKQDVRTATVNSREYTAAVASSGGRRGSGVGLYWYPLD